MDVRVGLCSRGIIGVETCDLIEREGHVANRLGHWSDGIVKRIEWHYAGPADKAASDTDRGQRCKSGRIGKRVTGIGAESQRGETGGNGGGAAATRASGAERWIVCVSDRAADRADTEIAKREFVEIGFADDNGAALAHAGGDARIKTGAMIA